MGKPKSAWQPYLESGQPLPFDEASDPDAFWQPDPCDDVIPSPGWLSDFVYYLRGTEAPTLYTIWAGLFAISTCVKREAWKAWGNRRLYSNFYTILVGPAGIVKKSSSIDEAVDAIQGTRKYIQDQQTREMKHIALVTGKATPEALLEALIPRKKRGRDFQLRNMATGELVRNPKTGEPVWYKRTSEIGIAISELASTVGRKEYSRGIIEDLLELYDPKDVWPWRTVKRGVVLLRKTHTTLIAATTPTGFKESIPPVAHSDGFISRCAVVYQSDTDREFPEPISVANGPTMDDMRKRLAWITERAFGEFDLSPEARTFYHEWYHRYRERKRAHPHLAASWSRTDTFLMKVALLIRLQRYEAADDDRLISLRDIKDADRLIRRTHNEAAALTRNLGNGIVDAEAVVRIERYLRRRKQASRVEVLRRAHVSAIDLNTALDQLIQQEQVKVYRGGKEAAAPSSAGDETYEWIGDIWQEAEDEAHSDPRETHPPDLQPLPEPAANGRHRKGVKGHGRGGAAQAQGRGQTGDHVEGEADGA